MTIAITTTTTTTTTSTTTHFLPATPTATCRLPATNQAYCCNVTNSTSGRRRGSSLIKLNSQVLCSSSPVSTSVIDQQDLEPQDGSGSFPQPHLLSESELNSDMNTLTSGCKACGREEIEKGCNGEGRIQGGIATVPGFGWWPIKAYRPCPQFVASGGKYRRQGQSMDEVAFGRGERGASIRTSDEAQPSKKKERTRRFKR